MINKQQCIKDASVGGNCIQIQLISENMLRILLSAQFVSRPIRLIGRCRTSRCTFFWQMCVTLDLEIEW